jgi:hypothetical protein
MHSGIFSNINIHRIYFSQYLLVQKIMVICIWTLLMRTWKIVSFSLVIHVHEASVLI